MNWFDTESRISLCNRQPYGFTNVTRPESTVMNMSCVRSHVENHGSSGSRMKLGEKAANQLRMAVVTKTSPSKNRPATNPPCKFAHRRKRGGIHHRTETSPACQRL